MTLHRPYRGVGAGFVLALLAATSPARAAKTDVVWLVNGDHLTGEIKKLDRARLEFSTDSMGTVMIEWADIQRVSSNQVFVVELADGSRAEGSLLPPAEDREILVGRAAEAKPLEMTDVIRMDPFEADRRLLRGWSGAISAGFDATKANSTASVTTSANARRRAELSQVDLAGSVYSRSQDGLEDSIRATMSATYRRLLEDRWYWAVLGSGERNDELGIQLRSLAGGGIGRYLLQTGRSLWSVTGGLAGVRELLTGNDGSENSAELFFNTSFEFFTYDSPKTALVTTLTLFPSLTESGRVRGNLDVSLRRELITDLFFELSYYQSYDSQPPESGTENDYGIVTSIGYSF